MIELKVRKVGNSLGLVLPREAVSRLDVKENSRLYLSEATASSYRLTPYDPEFEKQMEIAEEGMRRYRNTLRTLAK
jgi:putative addiction module antidote